MDSGIVTVLDKVEACIARHLGKVIVGNPYDVVCPNPGHNNLAKPKAVKSQHPIDIIMPQNSTKGPSGATPESSQGVTSLGAEKSVATLTKERRACDVEEVFTQGDKFLSYVGKANPPYGVCETFAVAAALLVCKLWATKKITLREVEVVALHGAGASGHVFLICNYSGEVGQPVPFSDPGHLGNDWFVVDPWYAHQKDSSPGNLSVKTATDGDFLKWVAKDKYVVLWRIPNVEEAKKANKYHVSNL